jgi:hypothetical protein
VEEANTSHLLRRLMMNMRSFLISCLVSGIGIALLSNLPFISICNCALCLWVWSGSIFAVFLYRRVAREAAPLSLAQGLLLGLACGVVAVVVGAALAAFIGSFSYRAVMDLVNSQPDLAEPLSPYTELLKAGGSASAIGLGLNAVLYSLFGMVGGLIGAAIFKGKVGAESNFPQAEA